MSHRRAFRTRNWLSRSWHTWLAFRLEHALSGVSPLDGCDAILTRTKRSVGRVIAWYKDEYRPKKEKRSQWQQLKTVAILPRQLLS